MNIDKIIMTCLFFVLLLGCSDSTNNTAKAKVVETSGFFNKFIPEQYFDSKNIVYRNEIGDSLVFFFMGKRTWQTESHKAVEYTFPSIGLNVEIGIQLREAKEKGNPDFLEIFLANTGIYSCSVDAIILKSVNSKILEKSRNAVKCNIGIYNDNSESQNCFCGIGICDSMNNNKKKEYEICIEEYKGISKFKFENHEYEFDKFIAK